MYDVAVMYVFHYFSPMLIWLRKFAEYSGIRYAQVYGVLYPSSRRLIRWQHLDCQVISDCLSSWCWCRTFCLAGPNNTMSHGCSHPVVLGGIRYCDVVLVTYFKGSAIVLIVKWVQQPSCRLVLCVFNNNIFNKLNQFIIVHIIWFGTNISIVVLVTYWFLLFGTLSISILFSNVEVIITVINIDIATVDFILKLLVSECYQWTHGDCTEAYF